MAEGFSFEEAQASGQPSATPGGGSGGAFSFEEALGGQAQTPAPPTPQTDAALNETFPEQILRLAKTPSPAWLQPFERSVRSTATTPALPQIPVSPDSSGPVKLAASLYNPLTGFATLENLALGAAYVAQPEIGAALTAAKIAPGVVPWWQKVKQLPQMTPEQGLQLGMETWPLVALPFIHAPEEAFKPVNPQFPNEFELKRTPEDVPPPEVQEAWARPVQGEEVPPPTVEPDAAAEERMLKARERLQALGGDWKEVHQRMVKENGQNPTFPEFADELEDEIRDREKAQTPETDQAAQDRYNEAFDRLAILHGHEEGANKALAAAETRAGRPLTMHEAAGVLEAEADAIPEEYRRQSEDTGIPAVRFAQAKSIARQLRAKYIEGINILKARGETPPEGDAQFPEYRVTPIKPTGFHVRRLPRKSWTTEFVGETSKRQVVEKTLPGQDFFLEKEGGELQPYAERRSNAQVETRPAPQREQTRPQSEKQGTGGSHNVVGTTQGERGQLPRPKPIPTTERPVAPEAPPPTTAKPRLAVEDLFDPKTKKRKGSIVKNQDTGEVVARFPSPERNPNAEDLADTKAQAEAKVRELAGEAPQEAPPKPKTFKRTVVFDEFANSAETPVASAIADMGGIKSKTAAQQQGKYAGNEALWDEPAKLSHVTHNKIYDPNGEMPDVAANTLYTAGLIKSPDVTAMNKELEKESAHIRSKTEATPQEKETKTKIRQAEKFGEGLRTDREEGGAAIPTDSLNVGDVVTVDGTPLKVTDISPDDGAVTLEDGKRYGVQQVSGGDVIYGEIQETAPTEGAGEGEIGTIGQKALNTADSDPAAARRVAFKREGDHHVHKGTGLIVRYNKDKSLFEVVHPETREILDTGSTRRATLDAHLDGLFTKAKPPTTAEGEPEYDFSSIEGFEQAIKDRFKRDVTDAERKAFQPIAEQINNAKAAVQREGAKAINNILKHFEGVKDIPFKEAVDKIQKAIDEATGPCNPF